MSYIDFDQKQLINLKYSLNRELLRTNRAGSYASTTIITTNTRKYHGLLVVPQQNIDNNNHVLLSEIDETIIANNFEFHAGMRMYPGSVYEPKGHKYLKEFVSDPNPRLIFRMGGIVFVKEYIFAENDDRLFIKYTLDSASEKVTFRLRPFLAFRSVHDLAKANNYINRNYNEIKNGVSWQLYEGYSKLNMQFSKKPKYTHSPDWYYGIEYIRERERGYESTEDLFVPGYFDIELKKGESVVISASIEEKNPSHIKRQWLAEVKKRTPRDNYEHCLLNAAEEFIINRNNKSEVVAGYPWFGRWGRDTFIALPGLTLPRNDVKSFKSVTNTMLGELKDGLFPNVGSGKEAAYNSVDTSLWFFWALQQLNKHNKNHTDIWDEYGEQMKHILNSFKKGTHYNIKMHDNGLIWAGEQGKALTWMDAIVDGNPVTPRIGWAVEINALWYNAINFCIDLANNANDTDFVKSWEHWPKKISSSFNQVFWDKAKGYLADYVNGDNKDWSVRPNMIFAVSLDYSPIKENQAFSILNVVKRELLTNRGLRTLSPKNPKYKGIYEGNRENRDKAYHQGTAWPWLLGAFSEAYLKIHGNSGLDLVKTIYTDFEEVMNNNGIGTVSEVYDGDPPHSAGGGISQAWSVAELLRIKSMIDNAE
ncbi:MAG: glycogen debranching enzyme family protein [Bacteroidetes bacterium]|nr:glycogen debranching enzyme family protein [Bacteroidota bacterium]MBL6944275.1 glycogen debranching enzyme family protein [Bacteroidales bacterium]